MFVATALLSVLLLGVFPIAVMLAARLAAIGWLRGVDQYKNDRYEPGE